MYEYGFDNLDLMWDLIEANPDLLINSVNTGSGMEPIIELSSNAVFKLILGNRIPSVYIRVINNPRMVMQHLCRKRLCMMLPFI